MTPEDIVNLPSMPPGNPSYPVGPYRFIDREYLVITYRTDPAAIRQMLPEPLEPDGSDTVMYEWIDMPDSSGFGSYSESGVVIPCTFNGQPVNYTAMMFLNDEPPITAGREIWGFPKRWGEPRLRVEKDTLTGTLSYAGQQVALGTMVYKHENRLARDLANRGKHLKKTQVNLKLIPCVSGEVGMAQLVGYELTDIEMQFHYSGDARLHLVPHVNAPVADLPVLEVIEGRHFKANLTLPYGRILHDYLT
ncbi:MAG: acetoacetate decarboxylase [Pseudomonadota bacterium]